MAQLTIEKDQFICNGKPYRILSGAVHYFRVVPEYWGDRLLKLKACGLNTVETCIVWNLHEPEKGIYNFDGIADIVKFIKIAGELGLNVIVRPGPYICTEWDFGGLPSWLLNEKGIRLRCCNKPYLDRVDSFFDELFSRLRPLFATNGGPIIAVQVENEYGSYGNDREYMEHLKRGLIRRGVDVLLFTSDGPTDLMLQAGTLPNIFKTVNFGSNSKEAFEKLKQYQKNSPVMCMEYWNGWFDHWGEEHHTRDSKDAAEELDKILEQGASVNLYVFHGGTNFGFYNGANFQDVYAPTITSYDYDAALSEDGTMTSKYHEFKKVIKKYTEIEEVEVLPKVGKKAYGKVALNEKQGLFKALNNISCGVKSAHTLTMEELNQDFGFILYRTKVKGIRKQCEIEIKEVRDRALIFVNGEYIDNIYRSEEPKKAKVNFDLEENTLDILVENMGRVNYGKHLFDCKGITEGVLLDYQFQFDWEIFPLELNNVEKIDYKGDRFPGEPTFYRGYFEAEERMDSYINTEGWNKGIIYINGFNLGRYWSIGPQMTLYVPAPLLKKGKNEIVIFELHDIKNPIIEFIDKHILDKNQKV